LPLTGAPVDGVAVSVQSAGLAVPSTPLSTFFTRVSAAAQTVDPAQLLVPGTASSASALPAEPAAAQAVLVTVRQLPGAVAKASV
jgi:hypothetical protein